MPRAPCPPLPVAGYPVAPMAGAAAMGAAAGYMYGHTVGHKMGKKHKGMKVGGRSGCRGWAGRARKPASPLAQAPAPRHPAPQPFCLPEPPAVQGRPWLRQVQGRQVSGGSGGWEGLVCGRVPSWRRQLHATARRQSRRTASCGRRVHLCCCLPLRRLLPAGGALAAASGSEGARLHRGGKAVAPRLRAAASSWRWAAGASQSTQYHFVLYRHFRRTFCIRLLFYLPLHSTAGLYCIFRHPASVPATTPNKCSGHSAAVYITIDLCELLL